MTDNEVWSILTTTLNEALISAGFSNVEFSRSYQPRQQGAISNDALYATRISSLRYGWQGRKNIFNENNNNFDHIEKWIIESTYQVSSEVEENPSEINPITSFDIISGVSAQLNSLAVIKNLKSQNINILRITDIRTPFFKNENDRYESEPSFDFTISYEQSNMIVIPAVNNIEETINRV